MWEEKGRNGRVLEENEYVKKRGCEKSKGGVRTNRTVCMKRTFRK